MRLELAVAEAAANVIEHACEGREDESFQVGVDIAADAIDISLRHRGRAWERQAVSAPVFDGSQESGFGLYIMEQCADEVEYSQKGGYSWIRMKKKRALG